MNLSEEAQEKLLLRATGGLSFFNTSKMDLGKLGESGIRTEVDTSTETVGEKIRRAITQKHPSVIVVGDADVENDTVGLRLRGEDRDERGLDLADVIAKLADMAAAPR